MTPSIHLASPILLLALLVSPYAYSQDAIPDRETAVADGLEWLAAHQSPSGKWDCDGFEADCDHDACGGPGWEHWDFGTTGLALLAFLRAGYTPHMGTHQATVRQGLQYLVSNQRSGGDLDGALGYVEGTSGRPKEEWVYNHAIATAALCKAYGMTGDPNLKDPARRAVDLCLRAQNPRFGWRYGIRTGDNDTSVTGWMVRALWEARAAGIDVPDEAFEGALQWIHRATSSRSGATGYRAPDGASSYLPVQQGKYDAVPCMTAVGIHSRVLAGQDVTSEIIRKGGRMVMASRPAWPEDKVRQVNMYYWYYGTLIASRFSRESWTQWRGDLEGALLPHQRRDGGARGSWDPVGEWGVAGGRIYATAICVLTLEVSMGQRRFY